jgi:hypothetical protein
MSHRTQRSPRRRFIGSVDQLDNRVLLTIGPVASVTAAASTAQSVPVVASVSPLLTLPFESDVARLDQQFIDQAQALDNLLIARIQSYEAIFASSSASTDARIEGTLDRRSIVRHVRPPISSVLLDAEIAHQEAFFNAQAARLASRFENQMANLATGFEQDSAQFATPASAFFGNIQSAATAFSSQLSSALTAATNSFENGSVALNSLFRNPALALSSQIETGATASNASSPGVANAGTFVGVVPTFSQAFNAAFTQALGAVTANIQSVTTALQQNFGSFQTQFSANLSSLTTSFESSPFGEFGALPDFVMSDTFGASGGVTAAQGSGSITSADTAGTTAQVPTSP